MPVDLRTALAIDDWAIERSLEHHGPLGPLTEAVSKRLSTAGYDEVGKGIVTTVGDLIEQDLGTLILGGWQAYGSLHTAARNTATAAQSVEFVELATQEVHWRTEPTIDVYVNNVSVLHLSLMVTVLVELHSLFAEVRRGRLVKVRSGRCIVTLRLSWEGGMLLERSGEFELPVALSLGAGIPLLSASDSSPNLPMIRARYDAAQFRD